MEITSSSGCGEKMRTRFGVAARALLPSAPQDAPPLPKDDLPAALASSAPVGLPESLEAGARKIAVISCAMSRSNGFRPTTRVPLSRSCSAVQPLLGRAQAKEIDLAKDAEIANAYAGTQGEARSSNASGAPNRRR